MEAVDPIDPRPVFEQLMEALAPKLSRIIDIFREWDEDGSGKVDTTEFHNAMPRLGLRMSEEQVGAVRYTRHTRRHTLRSSEWRMQE